MRFIVVLIVGLLATGAREAAGQDKEKASPRRLLLVTTTLGFRHGSIEVGERIVRELARRTGEFTVVSTSESPDYPDYSSRREGPAGGRPPGSGGSGIPGLSDAQRNAVRAMEDALAPFTQGLTEARGELAKAIYAEKGDAAAVKAKVEAVAAAELALANARLEAFRTLQASGNKLDPEQAAALARQAAGSGRGFGGRGGPGGGGAPGFGRNAEQEERVRKVLAQYLSPSALGGYDGVFFLNTTGELPLPDLAAFIAWVEEGHGFIGAHAASDTLHQSPAYLALVGGEFAGHGAQETVELFNVDAKHPASAGLGGSLVVHEEMYLFKNYDVGRVHSLLNMNAHPNQKTAGHYPVSWSKEVGKGRVFYTSLGHREDLWDPQWKDGDGKRQNSPEVSEAFQKHLLGGIRWALGITPGSDGS
jgi:type 1 glutamine amidotransferase/Spy/CpxP family protein refolding chaperone